MNLTQAWAVLKEIIGTKPPKLVRPKKIPKLKPQVQKANVEESVRNKLFLTIPNFDRQLPMESPEVLKKFTESHKDLLDRFIFLNLRHAIKNNEPEVILFKLGGSDFIGKIESKDYEETLKMLDSKFLKAQEYELVSDCRKLQNQLYINRVINESQR